jgi:hypothetical protein
MTTFYSSASAFFCLLNNPFLLSLSMPGPPSNETEQIAPSAPRERRPSEKVAQLGQKPYPVPIIPLSYLYSYS